MSAIDLTPRTFTAALDRLRFGHEAEPPINARQAARDEDIESLAASIAAPGIGLRQPLDVVEKPDGIFVRDGNRRLAALRLLAARGDIAADAPVHCTTSAGNDLELSLVANVERCPLHPIDQYEAFAALSHLSDGEIAARFGIDRKHVRRMLALGRLSPAVRKAWRDGKLRHQAQQCAEAFTLAKTHADQDRVLKKLAKNGSLWPHVIRHELGAGGQHDVAQKFAFVGKNAYREAGGTFTEDLFGDDHVIDDPALIARLAGEKLAAEVKRLIDDEGWSWAATEDELPQEARWSWRSISAADGATAEERAKISALAEEANAIEESLADEDDYERPPRLDEIDAAIDAIEMAIEARGFDAEAKAKAGCIVSIGHGGKLEIRHGVIRPGERGPATKDGARKKPATGISSALRTDLAGRATRAIAAAIAADGKIGLAALLAGHTYRRALYDFAPVRVSEEGLDRPMAETVSKRETFAAIFARYLAMSVDELLTVAAGIAGRSLNFVHGDAAPFTDKGTAAIAAAIAADAVNVAMAEAFDPEDFFRRAPMVVAAAALRDIGGSKAVVPKRKAEAAAAAVKAATESGWLPAELRTDHYAGPGASRRKRSSKASPPSIGTTGASTR